MAGLHVKMGDRSLALGGAIIVNGGTTLVDLRPKEIRLLLYLAGMKGRTATRLMLLREVWGYSAQSKTRTVDVHIASLRHKVGAGMIATTRGGYKLTAGLSLRLALTLAEH